MKTRIATLFAVALATLPLLVACENGGTLSAQDKQLFQYLPPGAPLVFGGNYMKLQNFMQSGFAQMAAAMNKVAPGMSAWTTCFTELAAKQSTVGGALSFGDGKVQLRMVFSGLSVDDIAACAQKASFKTTTDPDKKFVSVELPLPPGTVTGYLVLPTGALYTRYGAGMGLTPLASSVSRAELEADLAALTKGTAADDAALQPLFEKVDRSKTVWLVGHGDGTPISDKIGNAWGTFDLAGGLAVDVTVQVKSKDDAAKVEAGFSQLQDSADRLPGELKDLAKAVKFSRNGNDLHVAMKLNDAQLKTVMAQLGGALSAGGGMGTR